MESRIEMLHEQRFVGRHLCMSLAQNQTRALWHGFSPEVKNVKNRSGNELYSIEIYDPDYFKHFDPSKKFEKWAAVAVTKFAEIPDTMDTLVTPVGLYTVFLYRGASSQGAQFYQHIFGVWLPASAYLLDNRPHFAIMGDKYKNDDPDSEEEIWIPVRAK